MCASIQAKSLLEERLELPSLPYATDALEPYIDAKTMQIHHQGHHKAYLDNLIIAIDALRQDSNHNILLAKVSTVPELLQQFDRLSSLPQLQNQIRNHGGGYINHNLFWQSMAPHSVWQQHKQPRVGTALYHAIEEAFGSFESFQAKFTQSATSLFGSGWTWLVWDTQEKKLEILNLPNQDSPYLNNTRHTPILGLDIWEHAYYLLHQNKRAAYVSNWWNVVNWKFVERRFDSTVTHPTAVHDELQPVP